MDQGCVTQLQKPLAGPPNGYPPVVDNDRPAKDKCRSSWWDNGLPCQYSCPSCHCMKCGARSTPDWSLSSGGQALVFPRPFMQLKPIAVSKARRYEGQRFLLRAWETFSLCRLIAGRTLSRCWASFLKRFLDEPQMWRLREWMGLTGKAAGYSGWGWPWNGCEEFRKIYQGLTAFQRQSVCCQRRPNAFAWFNQPFLEWPFF